MNTISTRQIASSLIALMFVVSACEKEEDRIIASDVTAIGEETTIDIHFQDIDDLGTVAIEAATDIQYDGGRVAATIVINDNRFCDNVSVTIAPDDNSTPEHPAGTLTIDFGESGCEDPNGNIRKGKLIYTYDGRRLAEGSTIVLTTENYRINGIQLSGVRTSTNITEHDADALTFHVTLENGKAIFPDQSEATRVSDITWSWVRGVNPALDRLIVSRNSTAQGTTRSGVDYEVKVTSDLVYQRLCGLATTGKKHYTIDGEKEIIIDYGSGACDRRVAITVGEITRDISL